MVRGTRIRWKSLAESLKIQLSGVGTAVVEATLPPHYLILRATSSEIVTSDQEFRCQLTEGELQQVMKKFLEGAVSLVQAVMKQGNLNAEEIDYVLHSGRQSLSPLIKSSIRGLFQLPDNRHLEGPDHLKLCVAQGAAYYALQRNTLKSKGSGVTLFRSRRLQHGYGIGAIKGMLKLEYEGVIAPGDEYPLVKRHLISKSVSSDSERLRLLFFRNSGDGVRIDRNPEIQKIGEAEIDLDEIAGEEIELLMKVDEYGQLEVVAAGQVVSLNPIRQEEVDEWFG